MSKVSTCNLGDLIEFQRGYDLTKSSFIDGPYPVQSSNGILGYHNEYKVKGPGITIGRSGTVGIPHILRENFYPHNTTLFVKDFKGNNVSYIYYLLKSLKLGDRKTGSGVPTMNRNHLHPLKIQAIRDIDEQCKISYVLSTIEQKIELNNKINAELETMAKTLYDYWFIQCNFPDAEAKPYKSSGGKMVYNEVLKREIPEGWEQTTLWDIAKYYNGLAMQKYRSTQDDYLPVIKIREMNNGISPDTEKARIDIPSAAIIDDGDLLFSWSATLDVKIWSQGKGALNQHIFKVTSDIYPQSFYYFELMNYLSHFKMMADLRKTTMGHITLEHLKQANIVLPPIELIERLDEKLKPIFEHNLILKKENNRLVDLRDWLLPMLMNGQVTVSQ